MKLPGGLAEICASTSLTAREQYVCLALVQHAAVTKRGKGSYGKHDKRQKWIMVILWL